MVPALKEEHLQVWRSYMKLPIKMKRLFEIILPNALGAVDPVLEGVGSEEALFCLDFVALPKTSILELGWGGVSLS